MTQEQFDFGASLFHLLYLLLPLLGAIIHVSITKPHDKVEIFFLYYLVIGVGAQGVIGGFTQLVNPDRVAGFMGWSSCNFITELGKANFCFGVLGILSIWITGQWRLAAAIGYGLFLLLCGLGHIADAMRENNFSQGNVGAVLWADILIPIALAILLCLRRRRMYPSG